MNKGRPPLGPDMVDRLEGSDQAKVRLKTVLRAMTGQITVDEACQSLGINESRFHELKAEVMQNALAGIEPKTRGRPPAAKTPQDEQIRQLQVEVEMLKVDLRAAQIREELAATMPHVLHRTDKDKKKRHQ